MSTPILSYTPSESALKAATQLIKNKMKIDALEADQKILKPALIAEADGKTLTIPVVGKGKVQVTAKTEQVVVPGKFNIQFDVSAYNELPQVMKRKLLSAGVVKSVPATEGGAEPSVRITLNA
jgi:hypothetical protein